MVLIRKAYEPVLDEGISFEGQISLTHQSFKDDCDVNVILDRNCGDLAQDVSESFGMFYGDFTHVDDYQDSLNKTIEASRMFSEIPSKIRDRFDNSPVKFLEFVSDESNRDELRKMGLLKPESAKTVETVEAPGDIAT